MDLYDDCGDWTLLNLNNTRYKTISPPKAELLRHLVENKFTQHGILQSFISVPLRPDGQRLRGRDSSASLECQHSNCTNRRLGFCNQHLFAALCRHFTFFRDRAACCELSVQISYCLRNWSPNLEWIASMQWLWLSSLCYRGYSGLQYIHHIDEIGIKLNQ